MAALLPRETIFVAQIQDFNRARDEWQHCDIYQLYREPAVQDFLRKPLGNAPKTDAVSQTLLEIEQLAPRNVFVALTSIDNNNPKIVGGFRFPGSQEEAERIIGKWRSMLMGQNSSLKHEKVQYQGHEIEVTKAAAFSIATAYDPPWFFVGSDAPEVQALLDRADRRPSGSDNRLDKDETYRAAISSRSSNDVAFFYLQPKTFSQRLAACARLSGRLRLPARARCSRKCVPNYRLDVIRERKNTRRVFPRYAEAGAEHDLHALVVVSRNERDVPLPRYAAQSRGKNGHSQPGGGLCGYENFSGA